MDCPVQTSDLCITCSSTVIKHGCNEMGDTSIQRLIIYSFTDSNQKQCNARLMFDITGGGGGSNLVTRCSC